MIPLRDNIPSRTVPVVNYAIIAICALVFLGQLAAPQDSVASFGMIPVRIIDPDRPIVIQEEMTDGIERYVRERVLPPSAVTPWLTLVTCIFLHGGWLHFLGNMWFLYIFGDNVEDRMGHVGYALFYLGCGVAASVAHLVTNWGSAIPTIGASGAIAGVMGAYMLLYPKSMILSIIPIFVFLQVIVLPAPLYLGIWFLMQLFQGTVSIGGVAAGGVAWWAHIGGFAVGFVVAALLRALGETRPPVEQRIPYTDHSGMYRLHRPSRW